MAKKDLSAIDRDIMQPLSRQISDAFTDGIDCDVKIMHGHGLLLYADDDTTYNTIYTSTGGSLVIPAETATTYNNDVSLSFGTDSDASITWISATDYLYLSCTADGTDLKIGNGTLSFDVIWYGSASDNLVTFCSTGDIVTFSDIDLHLADNDHLYLGTGKDLDMYYDSGDLQIIPAADADGMIFGDTDHGWTITVYGGTASQNMIFTGGATNNLVFDDIDVKLGDSDILGFGDDGTYGNVYMRWDGTDFHILGQADDKVINIGDGSNSFDIWVYGETAAANIIFDASENKLSLDGINLCLEDDDYLKFGDAPDVTMRWVTAGGFQILPAADGNDFILGAAGLAWDFIWYGDDTSNFVKFDYNANLVQLDDVDLQFGDDDILSFGDTAAPGDVYMRWDDTDFDVLCAAAGTIIKFGSGATNFDIWWYGSTDTNYVVFDEGNDRVSFTDIDIHMADDDHIKLGGSQDIDIYWDSTGGYILPATDNTILHFGSTAGAKSWNLNWQGDANSNYVTFVSTGNLVQFEDVDILMGDDDHIYLGDGKDIDINWDSTGGFIVPVGDKVSLFLGSTAGAHSWNMDWQGDSNAQYVTFSATNNLVTFEDIDLLLGDDDQLRFGDGANGDIVIQWDSTGFSVIPKLDKSVMFLGSTAGSLSLDLAWQGETNAAYVTFGAAANLVTFEGVDLLLNDDDILKFGDGSDVTIAWDSTSTGLDILAGTNNQRIFVGNGAKNFDLKIFGSTTTSYLEWDCSANNLQFTASNVTWADPTTDAASTGLTLTSASRRHQFIGATGTNAVVIKLPASTGQSGLEFNVFNTSSTGEITVEGATGDHVCLIASDAGAQIMNDGTTWEAVVGSATT